MRTATILAALSFAATTFAQAVPEGIAPSESAPEGCEEDSKYNFTIGYAPLSSKKRESAVAADGSLILHLKDGILKDSINRVGSIVANQQFQFDGPPQAGAIYTGGFSVCQNASLAIGGSTRWWKCGSGGFFNLYDTWIGDQCDEIRIVVSYQGVPSSTSSSSVASSTSQATTSTESASASGSGSGSGSSTPTPTLSATPLVSINGTVNSSIHSVFSSGSASATSATRTTGAPNAPPASTGGAVPTRVPRRESFGAVVGILGAAWLL